MAAACCRDAGVLQALAKADVLQSCPNPKVLCPGPESSPFGQPSSPCGRSSLTAWMCLAKLVLLTLCHCPGQTQEEGSAGVTARAVPQHRALTMPWLGVLWCSDIICKP